MNVVIIGSGNAAYVLGKKIFHASHNVIQVAGRNSEKVKALAIELNASACFHLNQINRDAEIYILSVSDSALADVAAQINVQDKIIVHTAGAVSKDVLQNSSSSYGVLYPLQTLRKGIEHELKLPVLIDANNIQTLQALQQFAQTWSDNVKTASNEQRLEMHVAAVVVNNFTNHLFALAKNFCDNEKLDFNLLHPMIEETVRRIKTHDPSAMQTGPAVRNDIATIEKHIELLRNYPQLSEVYRLLTNSIIKAATTSES